MSYLKTAWKITRSSDFYITEKMPFLLGIITPVGTIAFYFLCKYWLGFYEDLLLRIVSVVFAVGLFFFPRNIPFKWYHKIYWECALLFIFPFVFSSLFLHNSANTYWYASLMWAGLIYGVTTSKIFLSLIGFPLGFGMAATWYLLQTGKPVSSISFSFGAFAIASMSAITLGACKLAIDVFYVLSLGATKERLRAEDALQRQVVLEHKNAELIARNEIISTFVRPSVVNEVNRGRDPRLFKPRCVDRAILICDMRNFTPLTESMTDPDAQAQFLNKYFQMMIDPVFEAGGEVDKLMGDAIMAIFPDGKTAIHAAHMMRESLQIYNKQLYVAGMPKMANVISIAKGIILEANIGSEKKFDRTWIGTAVNVCARLEAVAKAYGLEIVASGDVVADMQSSANSRLVDILRVKGYRQKFEVYEIYGHQAAEVVEYKAETREIIRTAIHAYFTEGQMNVANEIFQELLCKMPSHRHKQGRLMDTLIYLYAHRCKQYLQSPEKVPMGLDLKEGCHDFSGDLMPRDWYNILRPEALAQLTGTLKNSSAQ